MIYTWAYSDERFTSLADVKSTLRSIVDDLLTQRGLEMIRDREGRALYEVEVQIKLRAK